MSESDLVFIWGMVAGGAFIGVFWHLYAKRQRRRLRATERWAAELQRREDELWTVLR